MKQRFILFTALVLTVGIALGQQKKNRFTPGQTKPELFGIDFNLSDFNAPKGFGSDGNSKALGIADMSAGVAITYWKGLTPFIDFSAKFNGIFHDYSAIYYGVPGKTEIGLELEPTISIRPLKDENVFAPFLTGGLGMGLYTNHIGAFVPLGGGIQLNAASTTYFFIQAQYKWSITPKVLGNNMFYSIGFAQNISRN